MCLRTHITKITLLYTVNMDKMHLDKKKVTYYVFKFFETPFKES